MSVEHGYSDADLEDAFDAQMPRTAWRILARNSARDLYDLVREAEAQSLSAEQQVEAKLIRGCIYRAVDAASYKAQWFEAIKDWYSGASIETAWSELHAAGERLLLIQDRELVFGRVPDIEAALRSNLEADDPRLAVAVKRLSDIEMMNRSDAITDAVRKQLSEYQRFADDAGDEAHENVRSLRNLLIAIGFVLLAGLTALTILAAAHPSFIDLRASATSSSTSVWEVEVVGALGGLIAAVFVITRLGGLDGVYRLPVYQALIRIPAGAAVALAAVIIVQSGQVKALNPQSGLSVLAVALLFGYAPDVFLRFMDQRAAAILGQAQSKDNPARPPLAQPPASSST